MDHLPVRIDFIHETNVDVLYQKKSSFLLIFLMENQSNVVGLSVVQYICKGTGLPTVNTLTIATILHVEFVSLHLDRK